MQNKTTNAGLSNEITFFAYQIEEDENNFMPSGDDILEKQDRSQMSKMRLRKGQAP